MCPAKIPGRPKNPKKNSSKEIVSKNFMDGAQPTVAGGDDASSNGDVLQVNLDALFRSLDAAHFGNKLSTIVKVKWDTNMKRYFVSTCATKFQRS